MDGGVLVVAHGGAGHAAVAAAAGLPGLAAVVTVGTPWSPVSVDVLDRTPAAEALRLLGALLPPYDPAEPDDLDLDLGRGLVPALLALDPLDDPLRELRPPATGDRAGRAGCAGGRRLGRADDIRRAVTAIVAVYLADRARQRGAAEPAVRRGGPASGAGVPDVTRGSLVARAHIDLWRGRPALTGPALTVAVELSAAAGWLVGGPDPGRVAGVPRELGLRRLTANVSIPLADGTATMSLVLHDLPAFGVTRTRLEVTALLPEVRAVLGEVAARCPGDLQAALVALGVLDPTRSAVEPASTP